MAAAQHWRSKKHLTGEWFPRIYPSETLRLFPALWWKPLHGTVRQVHKVAYERKLPVAYPICLESGTCYFTVTVNAPLSHFGYLSRHWRQPMLEPTRQYLQVSLTLDTPRNHGQHKRTCTFTHPYCPPFSFPGFVSSYFNTLSIRTKTLHPPSLRLDTLSHF